jgi:hypothetical protein
MTVLAERPEVESVPAALAQGVSNLSAWLEGMRGADGFGGPIMHWWESNFLMTGAGFDWRYEGVIDGYRELYLRSHRPEHLRLAVQAAQDLLPQQLPDGRFRRSSFQFGPVAGGTPHEAALDVALLKLAGTLRQEDDAQADRLATAMTQAATNNILGYWAGQLWDGQGFRDQPYKSVYVPNKHATLLEALLEMQTLGVQALTGAEYSEYVSACVRVILGSQVQAGPQAGGTVHLGIGPSRLAIPIYTARTMNGLLSWYDVQPDAGLRRALEAAARFLLKLIRPEGVAWGVYGSGRLALNPLMIAGAGDVMRFLLRVQERGLVDVSQGVQALTGLLLSAQLPSGGLPTAHGFGGKGLSRPTAQTAPDLRDVLPVVGWSDKAFRALVLALPVGVHLPTASTRPYHVSVSWRGHQGVFQETAAHFVMSGGPYQYRWTKGRPAPDVYAL